MACCTWTVLTGTHCLHTPGPACAFKGLMPRQQRMILDLVRMLVHRAMAKFDQSQAEALLGAAVSGNVDFLQYLLRQGINVDAADHSGQTM
jgi:hypothetical protein